MPQCNAPCRNGAPCKALCKKGFDRCFRHISVQSVKTSKAVEPEPEPCSVCLESLGPSPVTLGCKHQFCARCITGWINQFKTTCPMCRASISDQKIKDITGKPRPIKAMPLPIRPEAISQDELLVAMLQAFDRPMANIQPFANVPALPPAAPAPPPTALFPVPDLPRPGIAGEMERFLRETERFIVTSFAALRF